ncbi:hypothetical protein [Aeropyrum camini]|uniref:6-pyruvoyl-tetrahydropterin synthase n=1 Tax=Aeropyrum camini SY1 = JCM 12091 TaxID=1198449 RepID=U3TDL3_9CREN|nr:hypothetical protein [Aeropyrum camini]BAN90531.1 hypothetical protein ACAM_1062 [Aeropyrum camini SY1 = JCM 12091]
MGQEFFEVCSSTEISVAVTAEKLGYNSLHGHDITVTACYCGPPLDTERIAAALDEALAPARRASLEEAIGERGAIAEDLLVWLASRLPDRIEASRLCLLEARWSRLPRIVRLRLQ